MSLGYLFLINLRAREARNEIKAMARWARRSIGQKTRRARERIAAPKQRGK